jgi:uncharacterized coiled-coil protein SlyX
MTGSVDLPHQRRAGIRRRRSGWLRQLLPLALSAVLPLLACAPREPSSNPSPAARRSARAQAAARAELERRVARLELSLLEKDAQVEALQARLNEARQEVVRAMAKLQTLATRAEAASGIAEAEVALQPLRTRSSRRAVPEVGQAWRLLHEASQEFDKDNYGGALYLANQAKAFAAAGTSRLSARERGAGRRNEKVFALPIPLKAVTSGNVREGPGANSPLAFAVEEGDSLTGYSYVDEWIRISDEIGRGGWIFRKLIARR